ncbi:Aste57867_1978 [Aphanomyces stellatus]|uniref:Aste57867_1978 protein n=1 Tax=Aphanomyces stellatus TaxID=120398 RepID=A0A485K7J3_9STRA|nr:hypothetical protein As57867_001976 [Aphanomyces stellatus]VFT79183.1 Aste57867_1978 [Aphanomyces stellatus]
MGDDASNLPANSNSDAYVDGLTTATDEVANTGPPPPVSGLKARRQSDQQFLEKQKKKLKLESGRKSISLAERTTILKDLSKSRLKEFEYKVKPDALSLSVKEEEISLKKRSIRHAEVLDEAKLMASLGYSKEDNDINASEYKRMSVRTKVETVTSRNMKWMALLQLSSAKEV